MYTYFISVWVIDHLYESLLMYLKSSFFYRSQTKLREGNVLHLSVILFTGGGGVHPLVTPFPWTHTPLVTPPGHTHPSGHPLPRLNIRPGHRHPCTHIPPYGQQAGGTHPTRMLSGFGFILFYFIIIFLLIKKKCFYNNSKFTY